MCVCMHVSSKGRHCTQTSVNSILHMHQIFFYKAHDAIGKLGRPINHRFISCALCHNVRTVGLYVPYPSLVPMLSLFFFQLYICLKVCRVELSTTKALERKEKAWYPKLTANMMSLARGCWNFFG